MKFHLEFSVILGALGGEETKTGLFYINFLRFSSSVKKRVFSSLQEACSKSGYCNLYTVGSVESNFKYVLNVECWSYAKSMTENRYNNHPSLITNKYISFRSVAFASSFSIQFAIYTTVHVLH